METKVKMRMIKKIFFTGIAFLFAISNYAVNQIADNSSLPDTIYVNFEKQFNNNKVKVFHNDSLILKEKATTLRKNGLKTTCVGTQIIVKSEKDKIVVRCGIWSKRIRIRDDKPYVIIKRVWGVGFMWVRYLKKPRLYK